MFANRPPLGLFQVQTFGGTYSDELAIVYIRLCCRSLNNCGSSAGAENDRAQARVKGPHRNVAHCVLPHRSPSPSTQADVAASKSTGLSWKQATNRNFFEILTHQR